MINRAPFAQVIAGEPLNFSAQEHNGFIDAALNYRRKGQLPRSILGERILLHNALGVDSYAIGDVVRVEDEFSTSEDSDQNDGKKLLFRTWNARLPDPATDPRYSIYAILTESLPDVVGALAEGTINDTVLATVDVIDIAHRYARPSGKFLTSTTDPLSPFLIVGEPSANLVPGKYDKQVWQRGVTSIVRRITVTEDPDGIPAQGSGEITFELDSGPEQWLGANHTTTGYLFIDGGEAVSKERKGFAAYSPEDDKWFIISIDCEDEPTPAPPGHGDDITASTTQTQPDAKGLAFSVNRITTCANDDDAVRLPGTFEQEQSCFVQNDGANRLQIFPSSGDTINAQTVDTSVTLVSGASVLFHLVQVDEWVS